MEEVVELSAAIANGSGEGWGKEQKAVNGFSFEAAFCGTEVCGISGG